jgi:hypothetical protein
VITSLQAARTNASFQFCSFTMALLGAVSDQLGRASAVGATERAPTAHVGYGRCGVMAVSTVAEHADMWFSQVYLRAARTNAHFQFCSFTMALLAVV